MKKVRINWKLAGWKIPAIAVLGLAFALFSVFGRPDTQFKQPDVTPPQGDFANIVAGIGVIEPKSELINIGVELAGVIRDVPVKVGQEVKKNDILFTIDQRDIDAQIAVLEKSLDAAKVQAEDAAAQFSIVNNVNDQRAIAKDEFNRRKYGKQFALVKIEEITARLEQAKITKDRLTVRAPIDGKVLEVNARVGEYANIGALPSPLIRLGDVSTIYVRVEIDEENSSRITEKSAAYGMKRGNTKSKIPLTFVRFEPYIRPKQNLAVSGQRVDTRVLQIIYAISDKSPIVFASQQIFVGQQMDVFIKEDKAGVK